MAYEDDRALACALRAPVLSNGDLACAAQGRGQDVHREHMATWHASGGSTSKLLSMVDAMVAVKLCFTRHPDGREDAPFLAPMTVTCRGALCARRPGAAEMVAVRFPGRATKEDVRAMGG